SPIARPPVLKAAIVAPLAVGGGMAVYKVPALLSSQQTQHLVCKIPHQRRVVYTVTAHYQATGDTTRQLRERLVELADHLAQRAPGLFPRSGGAWHWQDTDGTWRHLLVE